MNNKWMIVGVVVVVLGIVGVVLVMNQSSSTSETVSPSTPATKPTPGSATGEPPLGTPMPTGGQAIAPGGAAGGASIVDHVTSFATSTDGESWTNPKAIANNASVPDLIELTQSVGDFDPGTLLAYFVETSNMDQGPGNEQIGMVSSSDGGATWSDTTIVTMDVPNSHLPVDPGIVQLDDGSLRLYYFDFSAAQDQVHDPSTEFVFYTATSSDGVTFQHEAEAYRSSSLVTDPEVINLNGQWLMYFADDHDIAYATSSDGTTFSKDGSIDVGGIPGAMVVDGTVQLFGCDGGISRATSSDGKSFSGETILIKQPYCDPGPVLLQDGSFALVLREIVPGS